MLREIEIKDSFLYIGRYAGKEILQEIYNAKKSIRIITPYISQNFIKVLEQKATRQKLSVAIILSSDVSNQKERANTLKSIIKQKKHIDKDKQKKRLGGLLYLPLIFIATMFAIWAFWYSGFTQSLWGFFSIPVFWALWERYLNIRIFKYSYETLFSVSIPMSPYSSYFFDKTRYFVHSKVFIIDEKIAFLGSVNFTKAGFWKNYETRITIKNKEAIRNIDREFDYLFNNENTQYLDIQNTGSLLYEEPRN